MDPQRWDSRGRLTVRPEYRERLGNPAFLQVLTPNGLLFVALPEGPAQLGGGWSSMDTSKVAEEEWSKGWEAKNARLRRRKPRAGTP